MRRRLGPPASRFVARLVKGRSDAYVQQQKTAANDLLHRIPLVQDLEALLHVLAAFCVPCTQPPRVMALHMTLLLATASQLS